MAGLLVDDEICSINEIVRVLLKQPLTVLVKSEWKVLANGLDTPYDLVKKLTFDLTLDKITHLDVLTELLLNWRSKNGPEASLAKLLNILVENLAWKEIYDFLKDKIQRHAKIWADLDDGSKEEILASTVIFLGKRRTLKSIQEMMDNPDFNNILQQHFNEKLIKQAFTKNPIELDNFDFPTPLPYYIKRTLTWQQKLDKAIFKENCSDIFVLENIERHDFSFLAQPNQTDVSGNQLDKLTVRFILLEFQNDIHAIIKLANVPVHRIKCEENEFFWVSTSGSPSLLRNFLSKDVEMITEENFIKNTLSAFNSRPITICSSPGMGKSVLLAHLASELQATFPDRIVLFLELQKLAQHIKESPQQINCQSSLQLLSSFISSEDFGTEIIFYLVSKTATLFEIFLDGFDEIPFELVDVAKKFLLSLLEAKHVRIYISSRPHMQADLEDTLEVISFNMTPFSKSNQVDFMCSYWGTCPALSNNPKLTGFANIVLESLELISNHGEIDENFAGIPLQCYMLANVYIEEALRYLSQPCYIYRIRNPTKSLFDLYTKFMEMKFQNIAGEDKGIIRSVHWKVSLEYLFPEIVNSSLKISEFLDLPKDESFQWNKAFSVGIFEPLKVVDKIRFLHRTFAEFLVAEFISWKVVEGKADLKSPLFRYVDKTVLGLCKTINGIKLYNQDLEFIREVCEASENWIDKPKEKEKLKQLLFPNGEYSYLDINRDFEKLLKPWITSNHNQRTLVVLLKLLSQCGLDGVSDILAQTFPRRKIQLQNPLICLFLNGLLETRNMSCTNFSEQSFSSNRDSNSARNLTDSASITINKLEFFAKFGYTYLLQLYMEIWCEDTQIWNTLANDHETCARLFLTAANFNNVENFKYVSGVLENVCNITLQNFVIYKRDIRKIEYEHTPLHQAVQMGHYELVEYLINLYVEQINRKHRLQELCLFFSYDNSPLVIEKKIKVLKLLKLLDKIFTFVNLRQSLIYGCSAQLFTVLCDIVGYVPQEKDTQYIIMQVVNYCKDSNQFDIFVDWFIKKNISKLLTLSLDNKTSVTYALVLNILKPETLRKLYESYPFDLGNILRNAMTCSYRHKMVKTITELSENVNVSTHAKLSILHFAAMYRDSDLINYLLCAGANVNLTNAFGDSPLHLLFYKDGQGYHNKIHDCVVMFLEHNADVNITNNGGHTPLSIALKNKKLLNIEDKTIEMLTKACSASN